ncbi:hypothetical protein ACVIGB_001126 [Bradyrhizobium sp. USDA 4341]
MIAGIPWKDIEPLLDTATEAVVRLDERMARDEAMAAGSQSRAHFREACAALWLEGELVHLEDLVLHDAGMDIRAPTTEIVRAAAILRARRAIIRHPAPWALSETGLAVLRGRRPMTLGLELEASDDPEQEHAEVDALIERSSRTLETPGLAALQKAGLFLDEDWDEETRLNEWQAVVRATTDLPPLLSAAFAWDAWIAIDPYRRQGYLGPQLAASLLRERGKASCHLATLNLGIRGADYRRRPRDDLRTRLVGFLRAAKAGADAGLRDLAQLTLAKRRMTARLEGLRAGSRLPDLVQLFLSSPVVTVQSAAQALKVTPQAVEKMIKALGPTLPREITGRARFRAWGVF